MARSGPLLTEAQWKKIAPLLPKLPKHRQGGRPWIENRRVLEGILWILRSGARWQDLPERYPHPSTCWRRLRDWEEQGVWLNIWRAFLGELNERQQLKWSESFLDGSFAPAKRGRGSRKNQAGQGDEVDGGGRRPRNSFGGPPLFCVPVGSPARGSDARGDPGRPAASCWPSPAETAAGDCRQGVRQRRAAPEIAAAGHSADRAPPLEPPPDAAARRPRSSTLQTALDGRAHVRLAGELPPSGCPLRPGALDLSRVLSYRLLHDRVAEGCAIGSKAPRAKLTGRTLRN
jgi:transposase